MERVPKERSETAFPDKKPAYTPTQALLEANRCLYCKDAPCITACPTEIDIPEFIRRIAAGNNRGAAKVIYDSNILGMSCSRACPVEVLCVGSCVYNEMDAPPIQIGRLQRYATDAALENGWEFYEAGPDTGKKVALIGAGPASLAAAHRLRRFGHAVTIFDRSQWLGGLNTTGIAPYKLPSDDAEREALRVLAIGGIEVRSNVSVPKDVSWAQLRSEFDAIFLGFGLGADRLLDVPGKELAGIEGAVAWIERMKLEKIDLSGVKRALVIGGGNTAMDAVRELAGLKIPEVTLVYRGDESVMSGYEHEWEGAKLAGVRASWNSAPVAYTGADGKVTGLTVVRTGPDRKPIAGSETTLPADLVLLAIGQGRLSDLVAGLDGVGVSDGKIVTDARGATGARGVYAGGDCRNGGKEVVNAVAEGRDAAIAIHELLTGGEHA